MRTLPENPASRDSRSQIPPLQMWYSHPAAKLQPAYEPVALPAAAIRGPSPARARNTRLDQVSPRFSHGTSSRVAAQGSASRIGVEMARSAGLCRFASEIHRSSARRMIRESKMAIHKAPPSARRPARHRLMCRPIAVLPPPNIPNPTNQISSFDNFPLCQNPVRSILRIPPRLHA